MDRRRSSSVDQNQSREGRQERRDQTRFLKLERSRSAPPDLEKNRIQAAKDIFESLEIQGIKLINGFNHLLTDIQQNTKDGLSLKRGQYITYKSLVQSYTIYKGSQFAFETNKHNNYLTVDHLNKLILNSNKLDKLREETCDTSQVLDSFGSLNYFNEYNNKFINKSRKRNKIAKELNSFLENIKINRIHNLPFSEEQVKTYEDLSRRSHKIFANFDIFTFRKSLFEDYCNQEQQLQVKREVERITSISADVDKTVQSIRLAHPTFSDLRSQRTIIGERWYALQDRYAWKRELNLSGITYEYELSELCKVRQLIKDYEATTSALSNNESINHSSKQQKYILQLDRKMVQEYKNDIERFLAPQKDSD